MEPNCITIVGIDQFVVEIGGHMVGGWSEDSDALMMPEAFELITTRRGADGQLIGSFTNDLGGPITFKLLPNSSSTGFFMQAGASMLENRRSVICWSGVGRNISQSYDFYLEKGVMTHMPLGQNTGKSSAANQMFTFDFEKIIPDYSRATFNNQVDASIIRRIVERPSTGLNLTSTRPSATP